MPGKTLGVDVETYRNFFYIGIKRFEDGRRVGYEFSDRSDFDRDEMRRRLRRNTIVTFNGLNYDLPIIYLALDGATNEQLKEASDRIIKGGLKWWDVERELGIAIPKLDHIDLFEPNPSVRDSLKTLNGRLHGQRMQDLPYHEATVLDHEQMDVVADYCLHSDLDATENLFKALKEPLELRVAMGEQYGRDFRSKSDAQMGELIIKTKVEEALGRRVEKASVKAGTTFRYQVPAWMKFETPMMKEVLRTIASTDLLIDREGKVEFPKEFDKFDIKFGPSSFKLGIGGLHSKKSCRAERSDFEHVLIDADVASQYPRIIMTLGLYPAALGRDFLPVYGSLMDRRLAAKASGDKATDKGLKISINGSYGKLGSRFSVLYAPHLMIAVTLTGQLSLLMLIERAFLRGISVISGNTDGVVFKCPRDLFAGFVQKDGKDTDRLAPSPIQDIIEWWEALTKFKLEFAEYSAIYNRDVNCYIAIKPNGKAKRKGTIANHWSPKSPDYDPGREQLKKNPQMTVCADAALDHILNGTSIEDFIRGYKDIRGFVTIVNATGGATWRDGYLGKVVRYCWSTDGDPIIKVKPNAQGTHPKVPKTDGCRPLMNLPDHVPDDIDFGRYVAEAKAILVDIGFSAQPIIAGKRSPMEKLLKRVLMIN